MKKLLDGILRFRDGLTDEKRQQFAQLALGQSPDAMLIACADSRVVVNVFASTDPGDLFVVRNVGNIVPPAPRDGVEMNHAAVAAAVEFAVGQLKVRDLIICGHSQCGAAQAILGKLEAVTSPGLRAWLLHGEPALAKAGIEDWAESDPLYQAPPLGMKVKPDLWRQFQGNLELPRLDRLSQVNVMVQLCHVGTIGTAADAINGGRLRLHGWWFDIAKAEVNAFDPQTAQFRPIDEDLVSRILSRES